MATNRTGQFADALHALEDGGDLDAFVAVFADGARRSYLARRKLA